MNPIGGQVVMIFNIKRIMETAERTSELLLEILSQIGFLQTRKACLQRYNPTDQELIKGCDKQIQRLQTSAYELASKLQKFCTL